MGADSIKRFFNFFNDTDHYEALDHVRAFAALLVLYGHSLHNLSRGIFREEIGSWIHTDNLFYSFIAEGHSGVSLFLVLSGYLFTTLIYGKNISYWKFIRNRVLRIYPLYVIMVFCGAYTFSQSLNTGNLLGALFFLQGTPAAHQGGMFTMILWTISTEFLFYFLFPFLISFVKEYGWGIILCWLVVFFVLRTLSVCMGASPRDMPYFTIMGRMDQFLLGMLAALSVKLYPEYSRYRRWMALPAAALVIVSLIAFNQLGGWDRVASWKTHWLTFEGAYFSFFVMCYTSFEGYFNRYYSMVLRFVGKISYSIYLLHFPILDFYSKKLFFRAVSNYFDNAMLNSLVAVPMVIIISSLTYLSIERPFLSLRGKYVINNTVKQ